MGHLHRCRTPEVELGVGVALLGGQAFSVILWDTFTVAVPQPEVELGVGVALLGGQAEPGDRFSVILWDTFTVAVPHPRLSWA